MLGKGDAMWRANCHFGLLVTPTQTYVFKDTFETSGAKAIRLTDAVPTKTLLGTLPQKAFGERELEYLTKEWLERLANSYEEALRGDPAVTKAFFPDIVGAVAGGRVVAGAAT